MRPQEAVEQALTRSTADDCIVIAEESSTANVRWANNTLTTNGVTRDRSLTCVAVVGASVGVVQRRGSVDVAELVAAADAAARTAPPAEDAQPLIRGTATSSAWDAVPAETSMAAFSSFAPQLGEAFGTAQAAKRLLFGYAEHEMRTTYLGSSSGVRLRHDQPTGHVEVNGKSLDFSRSAWVGAPAADFGSVDMTALDAELATRLRWAERRVDLPAGRYETILPPSAVADLLIYMYWSASARDAHDGRTVFSRAGGGTRVGERLSDLPVTLRSDPGAAGLECAPFVVAESSSGMQSVFDNGLGLGSTPWIADGVLTSLVQTRHSAGLTGLPVTPWVDNLRLDGPDVGVPAGEMVAATDRGLLLTCLWYIREVDPQTLLLTGLTRDGVYVVEGGEVVGAANNFRFNESPVSLLSRIAEIGATELTLPREQADYFTRAAMPPLRIPDFNMSSVSQAA